MNTKKRLCAHKEEATIYKPGSRSSPGTESASTSILDFPVSKTRRNKSLLFVTLSMVFCYSNLSSLRQGHWSRVGERKHYFLSLSFRHTLCLLLFKVKNLFPSPCHKPSAFLFSFFFLPNTRFSCPAPNCGGK